MIDNNGNDRKQEEKNKLDDRRNIYKRKSIGNTLDDEEDGDALIWV